MKKVESILYRLDHAKFTFNLKFRISLCRIISEFQFLIVKQTCTWRINLCTVYNGIVFATSHQRYMHSLNLF